MNNEKTGLSREELELKLLGEKLLKAEDRIRSLKRELEETSQEAQTSIHTIEMRLEKALRIIVRLVLVRRSLRNELAATKPELVRLPPTA